jgi:hypothetical protein
VARRHLHEKSLLDRTEQIAIDQLILSEVRHERAIVDAEIGKFFCAIGHRTTAMPEALLVLRGLTAQ